MGTNAFSLAQGSSFVIVPCRRTFTKVQGKEMVVPVRKSLQGKNPHLKRHKQLGDLDSVGFSVKLLLDEVDAISLSSTDWLNSESRYLDSSSRTAETDHL